MTTKYKLDRETLGLLTNASQVESEAVVDNWVSQTGAWQDSQSESKP